MDFVDISADTVRYFSQRIRVQFVVDWDIAAAFKTIRKPVIGPVHGVA